MPYDDYYFSVDYDGRHDVWTWTVFAGDDAVEVHGTAKTKINAEQAARAKIAELKRKK